MRTSEYPVWLAILAQQRAEARADAGTLPDGRSAIAWSQEEKLWYARPGADLDRLQRWLPDSRVPRTERSDAPAEFLAALTDAGLVLDGLPVMDGRRHRVPVVEGKKGNRDGVYRGFLDGIKPGGWYINYHRADNDKDITRWKAQGAAGETDPAARVHLHALMRQSQDDAARAQAALYARQTASALALYDRLPAADPTHGYLTRKGITVAPDVRQTSNGALVVPFYDADGAFQTLQYIPPDGAKYLFKDAPKSGHFRVEGDALRNGEPILYAEGYATARSLHQVTGRSVVMTIDAGNMLSVAQTLKARYPDSAHLFMADVDHTRTINKGVLAAERAAAATGGRVVLPDLTAQEIEHGFTDFNDLHQSRGAMRLGETLLPAIEQALLPRNHKEASMETLNDTQPAPTPLTPASSDATTSIEPADRKALAKELASQVLALHEQGVKGTEIARQVGVSSTRVYRMLRARQADAPAAASVEPTAPAAASVAPIPDDTTVTAQKKDVAAQIAALTAQGRTLPDIAAELHMGVGQTFRALRQSEDEPVPDVDTAAPAPQAAAGEEDAIYVGAPRVTPVNDDAPGASQRARIDADKLLSRMTFEKQPDGQSVMYRLDGEDAFVDHGNRLVMAPGASGQEEKVLAALLTAANHYHDRIELTGSDAFKAFAIKVIVANGLTVSMKSASQQADLDAARRAAQQPAAQASQDAVTGDPVAPHAEVTPPVAAAQTPAPDTQAVSAPAQTAGGPAHTTAMPDEKVSAPPAAAQHPEGGVTVSQPVPPSAKIPPAVHTPAEKARTPVTGKVIACGEAPFRFEDEASASAYITLRNRDGQQIFWGTELAGLIRETQLTPGRMVTLQWLGKKDVTIQVPKKNEQGEVFRYDTVNTHRNQWSLTPAGVTRAQPAAEAMVTLSAVDANRYTQVQRDVVTRLGLDMPAPPRQNDGLYWLKADGQGSAAPGDPETASRPANNPQAGTAVMSAWGEDGLPDLYLVQGDKDYLQGVVRQDGVYQHVLVSLPGNNEAPPMVVNLLTPDGAVPIGSGNGINRSNGQPVAREHVVVRLTGDDQPRIAKLDAPAQIPPALHARLGYDERYQPEGLRPKEPLAAAPQTAPNAPHRPT